ncbi:CmcJ/NvfI family oxidoreductase [Marinobacter sp.]|uniref:CmcJ/NvfI family oxidoreductase n=1 Tax=Marinobacter sp. TaxID=50741 RepID=UPI002B49EDA8|nr:CmcJ/NvfI family oxidoreductase [Marinobacter sp.]HKK57069.1 CmcJ/NvfI family oxidoreductase [Marinobacter sp.]
MVYPDRTGEIYHLAFNPDQRWLYFPDMERNEVLLIKGYDSRTDGRARFVPHTAFHDPGSHADVFCAT